MSKLKPAEFQYLFKVMASREAGTGTPGQFAPVLAALRVWPGQALGLSPCGSTSTRAPGSWSCRELSVLPLSPFAAQGAQPGHVCGHQLPVVFPSLVGVRVRGGSDSKESACRVGLWGPSCCGGTPGSPVPPARCPLKARTSSAPRVGRGSSVWSCTSASEGPASRRRREPGPGFLSKGLDFPGSPRLSRGFSGAQSRWSWQADLSSNLSAAFWEGVCWWDRGVFVWALDRSRLSGSCSSHRLRHPGHLRFLEPDLSLSLTSNT